jgi:hypothetical protein
VKSSLQSGIYEKIIIKKSIIKQYFNNMNPGKLLHILNSERLTIKEEDTEILE